MGATAPEIKTALPTATGVAAPPLGAQSVRVGRTLYIAGQLGVDSTNTLAGTDLHAQAARAFANLAAVLQAAGASPRDVTALTIYVVNYRPADLETIRDAASAYITANAPIITVLGVHLMFQRKYVWLLPLMFAFVWTYSLFPLLWFAAIIWVVIIAWNERRFDRGLPGGEGQGLEALDLALTDHPEASAFERSDSCSWSEVRERRKGRPPACSIATRAMTCCIVIVRWGRPFPMKVNAQRGMVARRFLKPVMNARWTNSHAIQPRKPERRMPLKLTTARNREMVAMLPRSR